MITTRSFAVLGLSLIIALTIFGVQVVKAVKKGREFDRYLTVRGLSEREVKATLAIWPIRFSVNADDLLALKSAMERDQSLVMTFTTAASIPKTSPLAFPPYPIDWKNERPAISPSSAGTKASSQSWFEARRSMW